MISVSRKLLAAGLLFGLIAGGIAPAHADDQTPGSDDQTVVLAGGCFWGMQAVFEHMKGVKKVVAGYAGGTADTANYETVSTGKTGHAESVQVIFDPTQVSFDDILKVYFTDAHDPTELNYQGPDHGTQYRSAIFYTTPDQQKLAQADIAKMQSDKVFKKPIVTQINALSAFYPAEDYHQDYAKQHPYNPYIVVNDLPKLTQMKKDFPQLYLP